MYNITTEHARALPLAFADDPSAVQTVVDKTVLLSHTLALLSISFEVFNLWEGLLVSCGFGSSSTHFYHQAKIIIGIGSMRKKEPKQPTKGGASFGNAMSSLSEMCYDYDKLGLLEGATKQIFTGKKP